MGPNSLLPPAVQAILIHTEKPLASTSAGQRFPLVTVYNQPVGTLLPHVFRKKSLI